MTPKYDELLGVLFTTLGKLPKEERNELKTLINALIDYYPIAPDNQKQYNSTNQTKNRTKKHPSRILSPNVKARYLKDNTVLITADTPAGLAILLKIRPKPFEPIGTRHWNGVTLGVQGYRTVLDAFITNGYELDIGDGWGQYKNEYNKPYVKFDVRKK
ncbi:MAG: hypothetical protein WC877_04820 [Dehalococcoidales bacterium]|jgi:hypothetical protein